jgi:glycosyltransferase involved in cell wall biosynthesis
VSELDVRSRLIDPEAQASAADVENSYRLFLSREPDVSASVLERIGHPLAFVIASFLVSKEFAANLISADGIVNEAMLVRLDPDLLGWVRAIAKPGFVGDDEVMDRLTFVRDLLNDDGIRRAIDEADEECAFDIDALNVGLAELDEVVRVLGASPLFDATHYMGQVAHAIPVADPTTHYVLYGEKRGLEASLTFDAKKYAALNADVAGSNLNRLYHYEMWGRREGRFHRHWLIDHAMPPIAATNSRPTVLLLLHEATYTGAPILGWNLARALSDLCNVVVVLRRGGALENALRDIAAAVIAAPPHAAAIDQHEMGLFAERLAAVYAPLYAIANSVESRSVAVALRGRDIPVVALVHEFWPGHTPGVRSDFYARCAALVFPAHVVEQSSFHAFREIRLQNCFILPQGPCAVPPFDAADAPQAFGAPFVYEEDAPAPLAVLLEDGKRGEGPFTVIGLGAVEMRKGIDLFVSAATTLKAKHPGTAFRFIWIGTWEHAIGSQYAALLDEQYRRADLGDTMHFFPAVDDLEPVYARADALFLSSRLDPLPNITIDAAFRGIPVICFDRASGAAELLAAEPDTAILVVPHLDVGAAADRIAALAGDPGLRAGCSDAIQRIARRSFDMKAYASALDEIGRTAARTFANAETDRRLIEDADALDIPLYFASDAPLETTPAASYIDQTKHINFASPPVFGVILRRPRAGFHPFIYGSEAPDFPRDGSRDPLAHYIERGMPEGRWAHLVLRPDLVRLTGDPSAGDIATEELYQPQAQVAVHGHFHYPDNIVDFLSALGANKLGADLFLTTTSSETADILRAATNDYHGGSVVVEVGPNVGRDIYAFLRVLRTHIQERYDLVGHFHGKRSVHTMALDPDFGDHWRRFLWEHLIGPTYGTADMIVDAMRRDPGLGLVFPENGFLVGWEKNQDSAAALARRIGLHGLVPGHIEFPAGTMFWARIDILDKLVQADLREEEMPVEPVPIDGTMLHALERMLPLLCEDAGHRYATTYIPHIGR